MNATYKTKAMTLAVTFICLSGPPPFYLLVSSTQSNNHPESQVHPSLVLFSCGFMALPWSAQAAVTQCHILIINGLTKRHLFSHSFGGWKSTVRVLE